MLTGLYNFARSMNHKRKEMLQRRDDISLSSVRRISRVHPIKGQRMVAMTFDDGPCAKDFKGEGKGLTCSILDTLAKYSARATFNVIGTTEDSYPDVAGKLGSATFGGVKYDHYPCYGEDHLGGVMNQPELVRRILAGGHELSNHSCRHRLFGRKSIMYGARVPLGSFPEVINDLVELHSYVKANFDYEIKLARPSHYVEKIPGGGTVYDAYQMMGYQYLAASFDGDGWQPASSYSLEVSHMIEPMRELLSEDPCALNGQIIFQKDGCNMNLRSPIVDALPAQLDLLASFGYQVVTVSELLEQSPLMDLSPESYAMPYVKELLRRGHIVGYRNNTFHGERLLTKEDALLMLADSKAVRSCDKGLLLDSALRYGVESVHGNALLDLAASKGICVDESKFKDRNSVCREDAVVLLADLVKKLEV